MTAILKLTPSTISVPTSRRPVDPKKVQDIAESVRIIGLLNAIIVRKKGRKYVLVAGAHRLAAIKLLGYNVVDCILVECEDDLQAELIEIDENLIRNDITDPITIGELVNRREEILELKGLRAKAGDNQHTKGGGENNSPPKTTATIAQEIGIGERTLQHNKQLARDLVSEAQESFRKKLITKDTALAISRLTPDKQRKIVSSGDKELILSALQGVQSKQRKQENTSNPVESSTVPVPEVGLSTNPILNVEHGQEQQECSVPEDSLPSDPCTHSLAEIHKTVIAIKAIREQILGIVNEFLKHSPSQEQIKWAVDLLKAVRENYEGSIPEINTYLDRLGFDDESQEVDGGEDETEEVEVDNKTSNAIPPAQEQPKKNDCKLQESKKVSETVQNPGIPKDKQLTSDALEIITRYLDRDLSRIPPTIMLERYRDYYCSGEEMIAKLNAVIEQARRDREKSKEVDTPKTDSRPIQLPSNDYILPKDVPVPSPTPDIDAERDELFGGECDHESNPYDSICPYDDPNYSPPVYIPDNVWENATDYDPFEGEVVRENSHCDYDDDYGTFGESVVPDDGLTDDSFPFW